MLVVKKLILIKGKKPKLKLFETQKLSQTGTAEFKQPNFGRSKKLEPGTPEIKTARIYRSRAINPRDRTTAFYKFLKSSMSKNLN